MAKATVVIATHSRPTLLVRAVESAQLTCKEVEVVVVDDASVDETAEMCGKLCDVRYVRVDRNQRVAGARNIGVLNSSSEYITFLDDDDYRLPGSLDAQVAILDERPEVGMVYGRASLADQNGAILGQYPDSATLPEGDVFWDLLASNFICCHTAVFRKSCLNKIGMLDASMSGIDDWDLWVRIAEMYPVAAVDMPVSVWRQGTFSSGQGSSNVAKMVSMAVNAHVNKWQKLPRFVSGPPDLRATTRQKFRDSQASYLLTDAAVTLAAGSSFSAFAKLLKVFRLDQRYMARPYTLKLMALGLLFKLGFSRGRMALGKYV
jgi:glycosyltransferase involved in cell wall biosynthesis